MSLYQRVRSIAGLSLSELIIGIAIMGLTLSVGGSLMWFFYEKEYDLRERILMETEILRAGYHLQQALGLAVDVRQAAGALEGFNVNAGIQGQIRNLTIDTMGGAPGTATTMALYRREAGGMGLLQRSDIKGTGIFYQRPTPNTSGVLYLDLGFAGGAMTPDYNDTYFGRIVEFGLSNFEFSGPAMNVLTAVQANITMRGFMGSHMNQWNWCPRGDIVAASPGCAGPIVGNYRDYQRIFRVVIRNQIIGANPRGGAPMERTLANTYFFPFFLGN